MRNFFTVVLVIFLTAGSGVIGYLISYKTKLKNACVSIESLTKPGISLKDSKAIQGFFCSSLDCSQMGARGTLSRYDDRKKAITLQLNEREFSVSLNDSTRIDNSGGILFFERTFNIGDILVVIFDQTNPLLATEVYFIKTGAILQKQLE